MVAIFKPFPQKWFKSPVNYFILCMLHTGALTASEESDAGSLLRMKIRFWLRNLNCTILIIPLCHLDHMYWKRAPLCAHLLTDFSFSFPVFCVYYVTRGILQENRQELIVFVLSILLVMFRSIINFTVLPAEQKPKLLVSLLVLINFALL